MASYDFDIGVLGGGSAGLTVAAGAAQLGARTILIDKEKALGGDCLHFGCVPSKTLIKTSRVYHQLKNAREYGLPQVDPPPVDFRQVAARIQSVISAIQEHDSEQRFCKLGAKVEFGAPEFVDEHSVRLNGRTVSARKWAICTGSSPAVPPIEGLDRTPYITNREMFSLEKLPGSMIILGGGPIGIEMAQAFSRLGAKVTVVQRPAQILKKEDGDMAGLLMQVLRAEGVTFHLEAEIISVKDLGGGEIEVFFNTGRKAMSARGDTLLVATGRTANVGGLGLDKIGVEFDGRGIKVDNRQRTNHRHIYAAGDVTGRYLFTHAAGYEGSIIISNAVFRLPRKTDYANLPWCTYTDPELASIGMNEARARQAGIGYSVWTEEFAANDRSLAEGERVGKVKMLLDEKEKPVGIQILGPHAGELVSEWVAVMNGRVRLSTLAGAVHPYPTLGEINKKVAGDLMASKIFSERVRRGLRFFFDLKGRACGTVTEE
jgi:pyruvate/2-oxoglutarate dehydrogenase complex dihydrolipoamide dehydrogenase (E3) component